MLTVYGVYRSRASRVYWLLHEIGMPFRSVPVMQKNRLPDPAAADAPLNTSSVPFLKVNPNGHIPAIDDEGLVMCESMAINLYLAKTYGGDLGPADAGENGLMTMWSIWAVTELEPHTLKVQNEKESGLRQAAIDSVRKPFAILEAALAQKGFAAAERFTVADINLAEVVRYAVSAPELFDGVPGVRAWLERCQRRTAFHEMWKKREAEPV